MLVKTNPSRPPFLTQVFVSDKVRRFGLHVPAGRRRQDRRNATPVVAFAIALFATVDGTARKRQAQKPWRPKPRRQQRIARSSRGMHAATKSGLPLAMACGTHEKAQRQQQSQRRSRRGDGKRPVSNERRREQSIKQAETAEQLLTLCRESDTMDAVRLVTCLYRIAQLKRTVECDLLKNETFAKLLEQIAESGERGLFDTRCLSNILYALAQLLQWRAAFDPLPTDVANLLAPLLHEANAQDLANSVWAMAKLQERNAWVLSRLAHAAKIKISSFSPQNLSNLVWAFATLYVRDVDLMRTASRSALLKARSLSPQSLANFAWSVAALDIEVDGLLPVFAQLTVERLNDFNEQEIVNMLWAFAALSEHNEELPKVIGAQAITQLFKYKAQEVASIAWSCATLAHTSQELIKAVDGYMLLNSSSFSPQGLSNVAWSFAAVSATDARSIELIATSSVRRLGLFNPQEIANLVWACAKLQHHDHELWRAVWTMESCQTFTGFNPQNLSNIAWACATLYIHNDKFLSALSAAAIGGIAKFTPQGLANLAWSFAACGIRNHTLFGAIAREVTSDPHTHSPQGLSTLAWSFARLGLHDKSLFNHVMLASLRVAREFSVLDISNLAWACATLGFEHRGLIRALARQLAEQAESIDRGQLRTETARKLADTAVNLVGALWAFNYGGHVTERLLTSVRAALSNVGRVLDESGGPSAPGHVQLLEGGAAANKPRIEFELQDRFVITKPVGWEVYDLTLSNDQPSLSEFLLRRPQVRTWPILSDLKHQQGFLHRLDVPSSGLILVAKTYTAFWDLQLQLSMAELVRDYVTLFHGLLPPRRHEIKSRIHWEEDVSSEVMQKGKTAITQLVVLMHALCEDGQLAVVF